MLNAVLFTKGSMGDVVPFMAVGRALRQRGHSVTLVTHILYQALASAAGFDFVPIDDRDEFDRFIAQGDLLNTPYGIAEFFRTHYLPRTEREYNLLMGLLARERSVLITRYMAGLADLLVQERTSVPVVRLYLTVAHMRARRFLSQFCQSVLAEDIRAVRSNLRFPSDPPRDGWEWRATAHLAAWPDWFYKPEDAPPNSISVGFLFDDQCEDGLLTPEAAASLATTPRPILVTGGTGNFIGASFYRQVLAACATQKQKVLVSASRREMLPDRLPSNVVWFERLPFTSVMPHVAAVIHHAGTGTAARALLNGVPQLLLPYGGDRPDTGARIQALGVGRILLPAEWTPARIIEVLAAISNSPTVRERCRKLSLIVRRQRSAEAAADAVEGATLANQGN